MRQKLTIPNQQGLKLVTVVEVPDGDGSFPVVLLLHGFKGYKEEEYYIDLARRLVAEGVASVRFDASGFGESEGTLERDYRFSNYITDTETVYAWLKQQQFVDQSRIGVIGQSMGAAQTIVFASRHPEVKVAVAISPPDKVGTKDGLGQVRKMWQQQGYWDDVSSKYGKVRIPYAYLEDAEKYDFGQIVTKVACPLLVVVGVMDATVLPEQSLAVYQAAKEPKQLMEVEGMDHFYKRDPKILASVNQRVVAFVADWLK